jgi:hypothetical protein
VIKNEQVAAVRVPVPFFFEGVPGGHKIDGDAPSTAYVAEFVSSPEGLRLVRAFIRIARPAVRHRIVKVVQEIAAGGANAE